MHTLRDYLKYISKVLKNVSNSPHLLNCNNFFWSCIPFVIWSQSAFPWNFTSKSPNDLTQLTQVMPEVPGMFAGHSRLCDTGVLCVFTKCGKILINRYFHVKIETYGLAIFFLKLSLCQPCFTHIVHNAHHLNDNVTALTGINTVLLYCIVLYCIVLYCIVLYCIVLYCIVCIVLYCTSFVGITA